MDKEQVVKLARKAGFFPDYNWNRTDWHSAGHSDLFEAFAKLVAEHERKRIAKWYLDSNVDAYFPWRVAELIEEGALDA